jgi:hypothetical protein
LEAEHFAERLERFSRGDVSSDARATAAFWTQIMGEHADFIAHLLDPAERDLIMKAMRAGDGFHKLHDSPPSSKNPVEKAVEDSDRKDQKHYSPDIGRPRQARGTQSC